MLESLLSFFSDIILFSAGVAVLIFWAIIILIVIDESIDIIIDWRKKKRGEINE